MKVIKIRINLIVIVVLINACACFAQKSKPVIGGVYVSEQLLEIKERPIPRVQRSVYPIGALRVDTIISDTLLVKYTFGLEAFMDADFEYKKSCNCYLSTWVILFTPYGYEDAKVYLDFINPKELVFYFFKDGKKQSYKYYMTYKDKVDYKTHRNVFYAEDGFKLFEK